VHTRAKWVSRSYNDDSCSRTLVAAQASAAIKTSNPWKKASCAVERTQMLVTTPV